MTIRAGEFDKTTTAAVSATPDSISVSGAEESRHSFLVQSDVTIHLDRSGEDADPATSLRVPANTLIIIRCVAGDMLSFVLGTGETDGTIWFTKVPG